MNNEKLKIMRALFSKTFFIFHFSLLVIFSSCSVSKQITKQASKILLQDSVIKTGHIGISIYDPSTNKYWYNYNDEKYFIPASNTKLFTLYAGMKYLGDSLPGLRYIENDSEIVMEGTGDPTLLHPDFKNQTVADFLNRSNKKIKITNHKWQFQPYGQGWAWDDYNEKYMPERSELPVYGNVVKINFKNGDLIVYPNQDNVILFPINDSVGSKFKLERGRNNNFIYNYPSTESFIETTIPLANIETAKLSILSSAFRKNITLSSLDYLPARSNRKVIYSQPADSLFKPMMHNSDNFFAEQTLLMVSDVHLWYKNDQDIINAILTTDLKDIPQKPKWVDGSGLSRYNLFTPKDFIYILNKTQNEFGIERLKNILPTGGEGTLQNYYTNDSLYIYAKTGSLSNNAALSGFLYTKKGKLLIFSILANNFQGRATLVRRSVEQFLENLRSMY